MFRTTTSLFHRTSVSSLPILSSFSSLFSAFPSSISSSFPLSHSSPMTSSASPSTTSTSTPSLATFAAGCFWSVELIYQREPGVLSTAVGYIGGKTKNPTYKEVCTGETGHAEAVQLSYDSKIVSYDKLLQIFWNKHDPTQVNGQGGDLGTQYRSAIFYHSTEQKETAEKSLKEEEKKIKKKIATEIVEATTFYKAEDYHQQYLEKGGQCAAKGDKTKIRCYG